MAKAKEQVKETTLTITPPNIVVAEFEIEGTAPYMQLKFSEKVKKEMMAKQEAGSTAKSKKKHTKRDFKADYEASKHISEEGWVGIPAAAFRNACVSACRLVGFQMTKAKLSVFVESDGLDKEEGTPLVKIEGTPEMHIGHVRNATGVADLRARALWRKWSAVVRIKFDADQFTLTDITNLMARVGLQVGIGEGRHDSKSSNGMGFGTFKLKAKANG